MIAAAAAAAAAVAAVAAVVAAVVGGAFFPMDQLFSHSPRPAWQSNGSGGVVVKKKCQKEYSTQEKLCVYIYIYKKNEKKTEN